MTENLHEKMMRMHGLSGNGHDSSMMKKATYETALKSKKEIASNTMAFSFEKPAKFTFKAGQHIRMTLINPPETDEKGDSRFLSIASTPKDKHLTFVMRMRDTAFKRLLRSMKLGTRVQIQILLRSPHGAFTLHKDAKTPAVFIAGGIGIVPAWSMIKDAIEKKLDYKMVLFYSNRYPQDAPYLSELQALTKNNSNLKLVATMTDTEKSDTAWKGEKGHLNKVMLEKYIDNFEKPIFYVSGLPEMVTSIKNLLNDSAVAQRNINAEEYEGFNLNELATTNKQAQTILLPIIISVLFIGFTLVHITGGLAAFHGGLNSFSFNNPLSYLFLGALLVAVLIKARLLQVIKNKRRKKLSIN